MDSKYWDLTAKQVEGKATLAEQEELRTWLASDPNHQEEYQTQQRLWQLTTPAPAKAVNTDKAWQKVQASLQQVQVPNQPETKVIPMFRSVRRLAASVALLVGLAGLIQHNYFSQHETTIAAGNTQKLVVLPDSSHVWLNKGSMLTYADDFNGKTREVQLQGEAFFDVHRNPERPFLINTGESQVKVLGTSFNLRAYPQEKQIELAVATGKVSFTATEGTATALVTPGYAASLNLSSKAIAKQRLNDQNAWAWQSGRLQFASQPLKEVVPDLERYYGVDLQLQNTQMGECRFTGNFQKAKLEEVLQVLAATLQLKYQKQEKQKYILTGPGCSEKI